MMSRERLDVVCCLLAATVVALLVEARDQECPTSSCGNINNISHPFRLTTHPPDCGTSDLELDCQNNRLTLTLLSVKYYVLNISYQNQTIRLVIADLDIQDDCSLPRNPIPAGYSFSNLDTHLRRDFSDRFVFPGYSVLYFVSCETPILSSGFVNYSICINSSSASQTYLYASFSFRFDTIQNIPDSCNITLEYPIDYEEYTVTNLSISALHQILLRGFQIHWYDPELYTRPVYQWMLEWFGMLLYGFLYGFNVDGLKYDLQTGDWKHFFFDIGHCPSLSIIGVYIVGRTLAGIICLMILLVYRCRRRHLSVDDSIEKFLQSQNNFMPIRYSFYEIKVMTKGFKDKLGQGGYGSVFKAKLRSGYLVAVKLLSKSSKTNGQDFISEVATIGRIHHVNVVQLVGFCSEGSNRALVYDFMSNGSLDKFIFSREDNKIALSWERIYEIALGVARGIGYLHQGCDIQILHFDIKPHNILLDENFVPKVSDFGLAKLYSTDDSIVSLTAARGTLGYIAPELFYKTIGGVSYKADVYSFGMLLMEMVGRRKNVNAFAENSSQIYFPYWIYDRIYQGDDMELGDATGDVMKLVRKMTLVALWCIQMKPVDRPSMSQVLDMLEGEAELIQMPPKPSFHPQDNAVVDLRASSSSYTISRTS